ncbi:MAG: AraC family transcriptional regulator [Planctomycetota bacterium]
MRLKEFDCVIGRKSRSAGYSFSTSSYDLFQIIYVTQGRLIMTVHNQDTELAAGQIAILKFSSSFVLSCRKTGYHGIFVIISSRLPELEGYAQVIRADQNMTKTLDMIGDEMNSPGSTGEQLLQNLANVLVLQTLRAGGTETDSLSQTASQYYWAHLAKQLIDAGLYNPSPVRKILASLDLSYRQICRYFGRTFNTSPKQYQIKVRTAEAERLLETTRLPVTTIAYELGYPSSQHFATQFKTQTGLSPLEYRMKR